MRGALRGLRAAGRRRSTPPTCSRSTRRPAKAVARCRATAAARRPRDPHLPALPPLQERRQPARSTRSQRALGARAARDPRRAPGLGRARTASTARSRRAGATSSSGRGAVIFARALGDALRQPLEADPRVVLLGEDIADPYGGAFKVTRGLTTDFPERVRTTPISEAAIAGVAAGPGARRLSADRRDHVRRLPDALLRPDRQPHREVRGDVRRRRPPARWSSARPPAAAAATARRTARAWRSTSSASRT